MHVIMGSLLHNVTCVLPSVMLVLLHFFEVHLELKVRTESPRAYIIVGVEKLEEKILTNHNVLVAKAITPNSFLSPLAITINIHQRFFIKFAPLLQRQLVKPPFSRFHTPLYLCL